MKKKIWQLTVRSDFSSAHALRHYNGKCENVHGHNYHVEMVIQGTKLIGDVELLIDFKVLKKLLNTAIDKIDHSFINEVKPFDVINPSAENIAQYLYQELEILLQKEIEEKNIPLEANIQLYSMSVSEKQAQTATYREIEE